MEQQIHFCNTHDGVQIAYATVGQGPPIVKAANWLSHLEYDWQSPIWRHLLREFSRDHTFIRYDERGNGLSDWNVADLSFNAWVEDLESVVNAAGLDRFPLLGLSQGGAVAIAYAIRHPEKVSHLILYGAYARGWARRDSPDELEQRQAQLTLVRLGWGKDNPAFRQLWTSLYAPDATPEQAQSFNDLQRVSTSPENAVKLLTEMGNIDVVDLLRQVKVPTLVLHCRGDDGVPFEEGRKLAGTIAGARFVPLEGRNHLLLEGAPSWGSFVREIRRFIGAQETSALTQTSSPDSGAAVAAGDLHRSDLPERYTLVSFLGVGGMGEVYLADDKKLGRKVALKTLPAEFTNDHERLRRFQHEARAASALNHPNLLTIYEIGAEAGAHFIATEYVDGLTLREMLKRGPLKIEQSLDIAQQVAFALTAAHGAGIVHRDIKPENIMVRQDEIVKVLDFGLAKLLEDHARDMVDHEADTRALVLTDPGRVLGTPQYMSPEQTRGLDIDARTDIWSLGAVIYEMIAGRPPFRGETKSHTVVSILETEPPPLTTFAPQTPAELQRIVRKALTKDRDSRYQTARDLMIDLRNLRRDLDLKSELERSATPTPFSVSGEAATVSSAPAVRAEATQVIDARKTTAPGNNRNWIARHKVLAAVASVSAIAALLFLIGRTFSNVRSGASESGLVDSIAVLPFINDKTDPSAEYLADGIPENIIDTLSQLSELKVMSRNSVFRYKGQQVDARSVGRDLNVATVLTGHVTQQAGNLWISVELVNARDGSQIWGHQYNQPLTEVFTTEEEIAREVSDKLRLKLTAPEQQQIARRYTANVKAFEYYTQGRSHLGLRTREELLAAIDYYQKAISEDGNYALAYAGIAEVYANLGGRGYLSAAEARSQAEAAAQKALSLDSNLAEGYLAIGEISVLFAPFNFERADHALQRAVDLSPNLASVHQYLGNSYVLRARYDDALTEFHKARELDPLSSILARLVAGPYYYRHDYARAMDLLQQANELRPSYLTLWEVGVYIQNKKFDYAWSELEKEKQQRKNDAILLESEGQLYAAQGRRAEALQVIKQLEAISGTSAIQAQYIAGIYVLLGDKEQAFAWLERGLDANTIFFFIKDDPLWDPVRSDPRFTAALKRMGLPT